MKRNWKRGIACFLVLALIAVLCLSCGDDEEEGKETITVGYMTDVTGPAGSVARGLNYALEDLARYTNEENPIPGAKIRITVYDTKYDPSRFVPGFHWLLEQGARVIVTWIPDAAEVLKPFTETEKVPLFTFGASDPMIEPPGWVFCAYAHLVPKVKTLVNWLSEQWPNYPTRPKLGAVGWVTSGSIVEVDGLKEYCQEHPNKFEWVGGYLAPLMTMTWSGEIERLKACDYIFILDQGMGCAAFARDFRAQGHRATFISAEIIMGALGQWVDMVGWSALDGGIELLCNRWWTESFPLPLLANELIHKYHPGEAEDIIHQGGSYCTIMPGMCLSYDILRSAIEEVGAENFDGQAFYDAAIKFHKTYEGLYEYSFTDSERVASRYGAIYEYSADVEDLVRLTTDWLPLVME